MKVKPENVKYTQVYEPQLWEQWHQVQPRYVFSHTMFMCERSSVLDLRQVSSRVLRPANPKPLASVWCRNAGGQRLMEQSGADQSSPRILGGFGKQWSCHCRLILRGGRAGPSTQGANSSQLSHESACLPHSPLSLIPADKPRRLWGRESTRGGEGGGRRAGKKRK